MFRFSSLSPSFLIANFLVFCSAITLNHAKADALDSLEQFLRSSQNGRTQFTQTVTSPAKEGQTAKVKTSSGTFEFQRPNRFRFEYSKPFAQTIVADGKTLWLFDADLNQVTARAQSAALDSTPAAILASAPDLKSLRVNFTLENAQKAESDHLEWIWVKPKNRDGHIQSIKVGLDAQTNALKELEILDGFGQQSVLKFTEFETRTSIPAQTFQFTPPVGADLLKQ